MPAEEKLLIVVGQSVSDSGQLPSDVRTLVDAADEILVLAPSLPGKLDWLTSDSNKAHERADERLKVVLGHLDEASADAQGQVGSDDPLVAVEDAIAEFDPGHVLIGLRDREQSGWKERGLLDAVHGRCEIPVTVFHIAHD